MLISDNSRVRKHYFLIERHYAELSLIHCCCCVSILTTTSPRTSEERIRGRGRGAMRPSITDSRLDQRLNICLYWKLYSLTMVSLSFVLHGLSSAKDVKYSTNLQVIPMEALNSLPNCIDRFYLPTFLVTSAF